MIQKFSVHFSRACQRPTKTFRRVRRARPPFKTLKFRRNDCFREHELGLPKFIVCSTVCAISVQIRSFYVSFLDRKQYYIPAIMNNNFDLWNVFLGPGYHNRHRNETNSSTIDVLTKNCVIDYDTIACLRGTLFCFLSTVTGLLCAGRLINLHLNRHPNYYQYIVFYLALAQCFLG